MRETIDESIDKYQDLKASADTKKMHMAVAIAFTRELDRVGSSGNVPINQDRINQEIGSVDEVYDNLKEKIGALARKEGEPEKPAARDLAMMTALSKIKAASGAGGGNMIVDKKVLEEETQKVLSSRRFQTSYASDGAEELINKAWYGNVNSLDGYTRPANVPVLNQQGPAAGL